MRYQYRAKRSIRKENKLEQKKKKKKKSGAFLHPLACVWQTSASPPGAPSAAKRSPRIERPLPRAPRGSCEAGKNIPHRYRYHTGWISIVYTNEQDADTPPEMDGWMYARKMPGR